MSYKIIMVRRHVNDLNIIYIVKKEITDMQTDKLKLFFTHNSFRDMIILIIIFTKFPLGSIVFSNSHGTTI